MLNIVKSINILYCLPLYKKVRACKEGVAMGYCRLLKSLPIPPIALYALVNMLCMVLFVGWWCLVPPLKYIALYALLNVFCMRY